MIALLWARRTHTKEGFVVDARAVAFPCIIRFVPCASSLQSVVVLVLDL